MRQVIYSPQCECQIGNFLVCTDYDSLMETIRFGRTDLISMPVGEDTADIIESILSEQLDVKTIHLQETEDLLARLKMFFYIAKRYSEEDVKKDVILKHDILDDLLRKMG